MFNWHTVLLFLLQQYSLPHCVLLYIKEDLCIWANVSIFPDLPTGNITIPQPWSGSVSLGCFSLHFPVASWGMRLNIQGQIHCAIAQAVFDTKVKLSTFAPSSFRFTITAQTSPLHLWHHGIYENNTEGCYSSPIHRSILFVWIVTVIVMVKKK